MTTPDLTKPATARAPRKRAAPKPTSAPAQESQRATAARFARSINSKKGMAGTVVLASEMLPPPPRQSTGSMGFDAAMSGGFPMNNWTEVIGNENSGKTTVVLKALAHAQRNDPDYVCVWFASEPYDAGLATACGVDNARVMLVESNDMEGVYGMIVDGIDDRVATMFVVDSYPALITLQEDAKTMDEVTMGGAKVTNQFFRKAGKAGKRSMVDSSDRPWVGIFINQWREKIGVMHGDPRTTSGGKGKNFAAYCRLDVKRDGWIVSKDKQRVGQEIKITVIKMKGAPGQQAAVTDFYFRDAPGFSFGDYDEFKSLLSMAEMFDVIKRSSGSSGSFIDLEGNSYQGRESLINAIRNDADQRARIEAEVLRCAAGSAALIDTEEDDEVDEPVSAPNPPARRRRGPVPA